MVRDKSRDRMGDNELFNLVDYIPNILGAPLRKRGGWEYHGATLNSINVGAGLPGHVAYAPFAAGAQVVAIDDNGRWYDITNGTDRGDPGSAVGASAFYKDLLIGVDAGFAIYKYSGGANATALTGSPPASAKGLTVYKDRLAVHGDAANPVDSNRIWFSAAGNPESWDTDNRWIDSSAPIIGLAPLRNALIVFHSGSVERIRGDIPPGSAAANMEKEPLFNDVGLIDANALAVADEFAFFADENGVYQTDGASFSDLTLQGGISQFYREQFASVGASGNVAVAVWRGYLFVSMQGTSDAFVDFLVCEIKSRSWFRFANIRGYNFSAQFGSTDELYFSNRDTSSKRVGKLSGVFAPAAGVKNDADGDAVLPIWETGVLDLDSFYLKNWGDVYLSHDIRDAGSDNPSLEMSILTDPAETSYTALTPTFPETTGRKRSRVSLNKTSYGVAFKVAQTNASSDTRIYGLEADVAEQEGSQLAV